MKMKMIKKILVNKLTIILHNLEVSEHLVDSEDSVLKEFNKQNKLLMLASLLLMVHILTSN
jgi:hypothetical protein